jgi:hypothetical protein
MKRQRYCFVRQARLVKIRFKEISGIDDKAFTKLHHPFLLTDSYDRTFLPLPGRANPEAKRLLLYIVFIKQVSSVSTNLIARRKNDETIQY